MKHSLKKFPAWAGICQKTSVKKNATSTMRCLKLSMNFAEDNAFRRLHLCAPFSKVANRCFLVQEYESGITFKYA